MWLRHAKVQTRWEPLCWSNWKLNWRIISSVELLLAALWKEAVLKSCPNRKEQSQCNACCRNNQTWNLLLLIVQLWRVYYIIQSMDVDLIKVLECSDLTTSRRSGAVALRREANGLGNGLYFVFVFILSLYLLYLCFVFVLHQEANGLGRR